MKLRLLPLIGLFLFLFACEQQTEWASLSQAGRKVFLTMSLNQPSYQLATRSINSDNVLFEDRVKTLVLYLFDSQSGNKVDEVTITDIAMGGQVSFTLELEEGEYDFYFIANMPTTGNDNATGLTDRDAVETYLSTLRRLNIGLFQGLESEEETSVFFPMARVYKGQQLKGPSSVSGPGSSEQNPIYFHPMNENGDTEDRVYLNRAIAKAEVIVNGDGAEDVVSIKLVNGVEEYSLSALNDNNGKTKNTSNNVLKKVTDTPLSYHFYTPEVIQTSTPAWDEVTPGDDINYLLIEMQSGKHYQIPIASNYTSGNYLDFVQGALSTQPQFNVLRNNLYRFRLNIPEDDKPIEVAVTILPWNLLQVHWEFSYEYTIAPHPDPANKTYTVNDVDDTVDFTFELTKSVEGTWVAHLSNPLDFVFTSSEGAVSSGELGKSYTISIKPRYPQDDNARTTEFYITIDGVEISLLQGSTAVGEGNRIVINQPALP